MVDTIRSLAELNSLLADNVSGNLSPQDIRDLMVSQMVHAEIGSAGKSGIVLIGGWNTLDLDVDGVAKRGAGTDLVNHRITSIPVTMKARLEYEVMFRGDVGQTYDFTVWKNAATSPVQLDRLNREDHILNANQVGKASASATVQLAQDDTLEIGVNSGTNNFELLFAVLRLQRIGVE